MADQPLCLTCGDSFYEAHHPTGKDPDKRHLDPAFTVPACDPCHDHYHAVLISQDLDRPDPDREWCVLERVRYSLARLGCFLGTVAASTGWAWCGTLADAVSGWADDLADIDELLRDRVAGYPQLLTAVGA